MAVWASVKLSALGRGFRIDPEYYQPYLLTFDRQLARTPYPVRPLGDVIRNGFRVVYENTHIVEPEGVEAPADCVRFLQAADINLAFPSIASSGMGWVSRRDWDRYVKGRVIPGELLIEVKGLARKVAIVPDDFPIETLVSGSVFKLQTLENELDPYFLLTYLLSRFGLGFRYRCLTNTLIGFVSKTELYNIPTPVPPLAVQRPIASMAERAIANWRSASRAIVEAELQLMEALGLDRLNLSAERCYSRSFRDLQAGNRFGAEYYMPCKKRALDALAEVPNRPLSDHAANIREMWNPARRLGESMVRNFDVTDALEPFLDDAKELSLSVAIGSVKKRFQKGDVVVSRLRSYLKEIAVVRTSAAPPSVGSSEFVVLRPRKGGLSAEAMMVFLRSPVVQTVLKWSQDGSNHPRFAEDDLLAIPVPNRLKEVQPGIDSLVNSAITARQEAAALLDRAKEAVEKMITGNSRESKA